MNDNESSSKPFPSLPMWLVICNGKPMVARPREIEAQVYASGFSERAQVEIIKGMFVPAGDGKASVKRIKL